PRCPRATTASRATWPNRARSRRPRLATTWSSTPVPPATRAPTRPGRRRCSPRAARCSTPRAPPSSAPAPRMRTAPPTRTRSPPPSAAGRPAIERRVLHAGGWVIRPGMVYGDGGGLVHGLLAAKATERGTGIYIGPPGTRWPVVHVGDLAALYLAVATRAAPGTIWHGIGETVRLDAIATALGA